MQGFDKKKFMRLASLVAAILIVLFAAVTATVSFRFWWASLPTSGIAIASAVILFKKGYYESNKEE